MKKNYFLFFLAITFFAFSCGETKTTSSTDDTEATANNKSEVSKNTPAKSTPKGDVAYTTTILKDGIASPKKEMKATFGDTQVSVIYGSPSVKGRKIWGNLVPNGKVWRTGANEATTIEFSSDVVVNGNKLPAGKYGLFTIPTDDNWTIIFNSVHEQWGGYEYDESKDVLRAEAIPQMKEEHSETFDFVVDGNSIVMKWGNKIIPFVIKVI